MVKFFKTQKDAGLKVLYDFMGLEEKDIFWIKNNCSNVQLDLILKPSLKLFDKCGQVTDSEPAQLIVLGIIISALINFSNIPDLERQKLLEWLCKSEKAKV
jgi:hypothetical protein